jgi:hypothetical protein
LSKLVGSVSTQQIYSLLLEIKSSVLDVRWTYFQAPLQVEDALGERFPVPSEYDFSLLQQIIRHRFQDDGQVSALVREGDYELSYANNSNQVLSNGHRLRPGSQLVMAVVIGKIAQYDACPIPNCVSTEVKAVHGGGYRW